MYFVVAKRMQRMFADSIREHIVLVVATLARGGGEGEVRRRGGGEGGSGDGGGADEA